MARRPTNPKKTPYPLPKIHRPADAKRPVHRHHHDGDDGGENDDGDNDDEDDDDGVIIMTAHP